MKKPRQRETNEPNKAAGMKRLNDATVVKRSSDTNDAKNLTTPPTQRSKLSEAAYDEESGRDHRHELARRGHDTVWPNEDTDTKMLPESDETVEDEEVE